MEVVSSIGNEFAYSEKVLRIGKHLRETLTGLVRQITRTTEEVAIIEGSRDEMALQLGISRSSMDRHLNQLVKAGIIKVGGIRGRGGKTVIGISSGDLVYNSTGLKNHSGVSDELFTELMNETRPTPKPENPFHYAKPRRTKVEMQKVHKRGQTQRMGEEFLNKQTEHKRIVPLEVFHQSVNFEEDLKGYILSLVYNRVGIVTVNRHNADPSNDTHHVKPITTNYRILGERFFGTSTFQNFKVLNRFLEENSEICPITYLEAVVKQSVFVSSRNRRGRVLPYANTLATEHAHDVYRREMAYYHTKKARDGSRRQTTILSSDEYLKMLLKMYRNVSKENYDNIEGNGTGVGLHTGFLEGIKDTEIKSQNHFYGKKFYDETIEKLKSSEFSETEQAQIKTYLQEQIVGQVKGVLFLDSDRKYKSQVLTRQFQYYESMRKANDITEDEYIIGIGRIMNKEQGYEGLYKNSSSLFNTMDVQDGASELSSWLQSATNMGYDKEVVERFHESFNIKKTITGLLDINHYIHQWVVELDGYVEKTPQDIEIHVMNKQANMTKLAENMVAQRNAVETFIEKGTAGHDGGYIAWAKDNKMSMYSLIYES